LKAGARRRIVVLDQQPKDTGSTSPEVKRAGKYATQGMVALELPFTMVGAMVVGGVLGYFLDHWLHTKVLFTLILGGLGFVAGLKEVLRRLG
jgi:F0F1-type ATP synthase assembly protein I